MNRRYAISESENTLVTRLTKIIMTVYETRLRRGAQAPSHSDVSPAERPHAVESDTLGIQVLPHNCYV